MDLDLRVDLDDLGAGFSWQHSIPVSRPSPQSSHQATVSSTVIMVNVIADTVASKAIFDPSQTAHTRSRQPGRPVDSPAGWPVVSPPDEEALPFFTGGPVSVAASVAVSGETVVPPVVPPAESGAARPEELVTAPLAELVVLPPGVVVLPPPVLFPPSPAPSSSAPPGPQLSGLANLLL